MIIFLCVKSLKVPNNFTAFVHLFMLLFAQVINFNVNT